MRRRYSWTPGPALFHADGSRVNKDHPGQARREAHAVRHRTGGHDRRPGDPGSAVAGQSAGVTAPVNVYFGNPLIKEAGIIVDWSGLLPGTIGVYQINCRIPGAHIKVTRCRSR